MPGDVGVDIVMGGPISPFRGRRIAWRAACAVTWVVLQVVEVASSLIHPRRRPGGMSTLAIESGARGWELLEYEELAASAEEFLGPDCVRRVTITDRRRYLRGVRQALRAGGISHYFYDPRTGSQAKRGAVWQSLLVGILLSWWRVTPIARAADFPLRRQRLQCALVTARRGTCLIVFSPAAVRGFFPHGRLVGPMMMALSESRAQALRAARESRPVNPRPRAVFNGTLYEPRTEILKAVQAGVRSRGLDLELETRELGQERETSDQIWGHYLRADVFFTTAIPSSEPGTDRVGSSHLTYRYTEALAAGAVLIAPVVSGAEGLFRADIDYVSYGSVEDAVDAIERCLRNERLRRDVAASGSRRVASLVADQTYWRAVDSALGRRRFVRLCP